MATSRLLTISAIGVGRRGTTNRLKRDARIAANMVKLPEFLRKSK
jgi:hypothetical protein